MKNVCSFEKYFPIIQQFPCVHELYLETIYSFFKYKVRNQINKKRIQIVFCDQFHYFLINGNSEAADRKRQWIN